MPLTISTVYGISCAMAAFLWAITHRNDQRVGKVFHSVLGITVMYGWIFPALLRVENYLTPWKFDPMLNALDGALGLSVLTFSNSLPRWLWIVFAVIYKSLLWMITFWGWLHLKRPRGTFRALVAAFVTSYVIAGFLYLIVPACGPAYVPISIFQNKSFWPMLLQGEPNAMPSMHVASALMLVLFAGESRWLRAISILFLAGTACGTVLGEHYFVDWAGAVPLACFAESLGRGEKRRAVTYLAITLAWLLLIRLAGPAMIRYPITLWIAVVAMLAIGVDAVNRAWRYCSKVNDERELIPDQRLAA